MMSFHGMAGNVGDAVAPLVAGALLTMLTWRGVVMVNVLPGMCWRWCCCCISVSRGRGSARLGLRRNVLGEGVFDGFGALLRNRTVTMLALGSAFRAITQVSLLIFVPVFIAHVLGYSEFWIGVCMFALQACGFAAAPIAGHLSDRMGRRQ